MTTFELLDFTEAKELVKSGQYNPALPKLYRLAGSYPQDQEIQDLIKLCLNVQQPPPAIAHPVYQPIQYPVYQAMHLSKPSTATKNQTGVYSLPGVGILTLLVSVFLPWISMGFGNAAIYYEITFNGIGTINGSPVVTSDLKPADLAKITSQLNGWYLIAIIAVMVFFILTGVASRNAAPSFLLLVASIFAIAFIAWQYVTIQDFSNTTTANLKAWSTSTLSTSVGVVTPGFGLTVGIVGVIITFVGSIIACSVLDKSVYK